MRIGDHDISRATSHSIAQRYAADFPKTVLYYDLGGRADAAPGASGAAAPVDRITLGDLGRLVVFNARLQSSDVAKLMEVEVTEVLDPDVLPPDARLEEWGFGAPWEDAAIAAYDAFRVGKGIQRAKRSKLLHLKRPWLVPIHDSRIDVIYRTAAVNRGRASGVRTAYWEVIRDDLIAGEADLAWLAGQLRSSDDETQRQMGRLTPLRLLDVLAWTLAQRDRA